MEEEKDPSPEYIKGFNQMYKLRKEMPEVADKMLSADAKGDRFEGMVAGAKQLERELFLEEMMKNKSKAKERER